FLIKEPKVLHYYNRLIRKKLREWPVEWFIVGLDRSSCYYVIDLEEGSLRVFSVGNDNYSFENDESISRAELDELVNPRNREDIKSFVSHIFKALEKDVLSI